MSMICDITNSLEAKFGTPRKTLSVQRCDEEASSAQLNG